MNYNVIMAVDKFGGYSKDSTIPWYIPNELKYFNTITRYCNNDMLSIVIMGKNTWESLPVKPLIGRINIVISKTMKQSENKDCYVFNDIESMNSFILDEFYFNEKFIIGGNDIINTLIEINKNNINRIYISEIKDNYHCDKFLNISDHLLNYNCMTYSKIMHDRIKNKEQTILFKKYFYKNILQPDFDVFYKVNNKSKMIRIYKNDTISQSPH